MGRLSTTECTYLPTYLCSTGRLTVNYLEIRELWYVV